MISDLPIQVASDDELAGAVEANLFALFRAMTTLPDSELEENAGLCRHFAFPSNPMFKGAWRTRLQSTELEDEIVDTIAWFQAREAPFFFWWTGPGTTPPELTDRLLAHGLVSMEGQIQAFAPGSVSTEIGAPGMIADLQETKEDVLEQTPPGFSIEEVLDERALADFKEVLIEGYSMPEIAADGWVQATHRFGLGKTPWRMYLGRLNGRPVASNMVMNGAGVAGLYGVATIPEARGKGIGGAISLQPLLEARRQGYRYAVLFSSEMGINVYQRIGFKPTLTRINRYLWRKA